MGKEILVQYCEMKEEIRDLRQRIQKLDRFLEHPPVVSDTVRGTRKDGTTGPIRITGIPNPEYYRKQNARQRYRLLLEQKEVELLDLTCQVEEYIESIPQSELRIMFRLYFIDGQSYLSVARQMNRMFRERRIRYTDESIRKRIQRFFEKN